MSAFRGPAPHLCSILLFALVTVMAPRPTDAALFEYSLAVSGFLSATGTIEFDDLTGSGPADPDFADFSLTVTSSFNAPSGSLPFTFTKSMVTAIDWVIDPITSALQLDLDVASQTAGGFTYDVALDSLPPLAPAVSCGGSTVTFNGDSAAACVFLPGVINASTFGSLSATQIAVPEPGTLALLVVVLLGFTVLRYGRLTR